MDRNNDSGLTRKFDVTQNEVDSAKVKVYKKKGRKGGKRAVSGILTCFITFVLIGVITGIIVGATFIKYINDYLVEDYDIVGLQMNIDQTTKIYYTDGDTAIVILHHEADK